MTLKNSIITDLDAFFNNAEFAVDALYTASYVAPPVTPIALTDIVVGYPTILKKTAHGLANGDVVTLANFAGIDAELLNDVETIVQFVTANTFAVPIDTTSKAITDNGNAATATPEPDPPAPVTIKVIFNKEYDAISGVGGFRYFCLAKTADVAAAKPGETLVIETVTYKIKDSPHHTGDGTSEIELSID